MLKLNDGRSELWQWDTGRKLTVDAECSQVHFSNKVFGRSIDMPVIDGVVEVPDFLLQTDKDLNVWAFVGTAENGYTKISKVFKVNKRNKPADYVFTPHDQTTLGEIVQRLEQLEAMQDPDAIRDAVDEYLANNPIEVEETDPTVPDWAKQPEPPKVEIPEVNIPTTLPNPHALTFTGAVDVIYDGSKPAEVVIPQDGDGSEDWEFINRTTLLEDAAITVINSDSNGNSFKYKKLMVYAVSRNKTNQNVTMLALDANGKDLWATGEAIDIVLGDGVSATVTAEVIAERMVKQICATLSNTIKEHFTYALDGHSQNAKYAYMTGYKFSGNLSAGSIIELYGKGRVSA